LSDQTIERLAHDPRIGQSTVASYGQATLNGASIEMLVFAPAGSAPPVTVHGRLPSGDNEIALGARLMRQLGVHLGDHVTLSVADGDFQGDSEPRDVTLNVVGEALVPALGESDLSEEAATTFAAVEAAGGTAPPRYVMARIKTRDPQRVIGELSDELSEEMITDVIPSQIVNLHRVRTVPELGIALALALALIVLVSTVLASVRANRSQLAVLRALGMTRGQSRRSLAWLGTAVSVTLVAIAIPAALLLGSIVWRRTSADLGVVPGTAIPWPLLALVTTAFLAVGIVSATTVDKRGRDSRVATLLRSE
jgi:ABC-type lipoprotein release transport system permease subunit